MTVTPNSKKNFEKLKVSGLNVHYMFFNYLRPFLLLLNTPPQARCIPSSSRIQRCLHGDNGLVKILAGFSAVLM